MAALCFLFFVCTPAYASSEEAAEPSTAAQTTEIAPAIEPPVISGKAVKKEAARAPAADTTWQDDFTFDTDEEKKTITLRSYTGGSTDLVIPSEAVIGGTAYRVMLGNNGETSAASAFKGTGVRRLSFEKGVKAADEPNLFSETGIEKLDLTGLDTSGMTTMKKMFYNSAKLGELVLSGMDTSHVRDMDYMFSGLDALTSIDVTMLDLGNVSSMNKWFYSCDSLKEINARNVRTPSLTSCDLMLGECRKLNHADISSFDLSKVPASHQWTVFSKCGLDSVTLNSTVLIPSVYHDGARNALLCWNTKKDGSGVNYFQGQYCQESGAVTLYTYKWIPADYIATGTEGYMLYKEDEPDKKEYVYCLNRYLLQPLKHRYAIIDSEKFGGFTKKQKLLLAAAILMQDHADGASIKNVIWDITNNKGRNYSGSKNDKYYAYLEEHCEELEGAYQMNFYISCSNAVQNLLSVQQVRIPTSLKIAKKMEGGSEEDGKKEYTMNLTLTDSDGKPLAGTYTVKKDEGTGSVTPDSRGTCRISLRPGQYAVIRNLPAGTKYKVTEDPGSAKGFDVSYTGAEGSVEADKVNTATVTNTVPDTEVEISKQDISGEEIEGAKLEITHKENDRDVTDEAWTSEKGVTHKTKLKPGDYILHESGAPDGYILASDIPFTVTGDRKVMVKDEVKDKIVMTDKYETGNLTVEKTVKGSMGDRNTKFHFTIRLLLDNKPVSGSFERSDGEKLEFDENGEAKIQLSHGESVTLTGIRSGTKYSVTEEEAGEDGYTTDSSDDEGTISKDGKTASFVNMREGTVPTGADAGGLSAKETGTLTVILCAALAGMGVLKKYIAVS